MKQTWSEKGRMRVHLCGYLGVASGEGTFLAPGEALQGRRCYRSLFALR